MKYIMIKYHASPFNYNFLTYLMEKHGTSKLEFLK